MTEQTNVRTLQAVGEQAPPCPGSPFRSAPSRRQCGRRGGFAADRHRASTARAPRSLQAVPMGHKVATRAIAKGEAVLKFGQIIGYATDDIAPGAHVHVHNCAMGEPRPGLQDRRRLQAGAIPRPVGGDLQGPRRADGRVGTTQLHRALLDRELLGDGDPHDRRPREPFRHARRLSAYRRRHRALARHRLRHGGRRRRLRQSGACAVGLRHASERLRGDLRRARLRGDADRPAQTQIRFRRGPLPHADHPGIGRHAPRRGERGADDRGAPAVASGRSSARMFRQAS